MSAVRQRFIPSQGIRRVPWLTLIVSGVTVALYLLGADIFDFLLFDKAAFLKGEVWRGFTGHWVHLNVTHLFWDLAAFIILGAIIELQEPRCFLPALLLSCLFVSGWVYFGEWNLSKYYGLSGALNGLLVVAAVLQWKVSGQNSYLMVLFLTLCKIIYEYTTQQAIFAGSAVNPVPGAHAAGFVAGVLYVVWNGLIAYPQGRRNL